MNRLSPTTLAMLATVAGTGAEASAEQGLPTLGRGVFFVPRPAVEGGRAGDGRLLPIVLARERALPDGSGRHHGRLHSIDGGGRGDCKKNRELHPGTSWHAVRTYWNRTLRSCRAHPETSLFRDSLITWRSGGAPVHAGLPNSGVAPACSGTPLLSPRGLRMAAA